MQTRDVIPEADNTRNLGSTTRRYKSLFLGPGSLTIGDTDYGNTWFQWVDETRNWAKPFFVQNTYAIATYPTNTAINATYKSNTAIHTHLTATYATNTAINTRLGPYLQVANVVSGVSEDTSMAFSIALG